MYINILISFETGSKGEIKWITKQIDKHLKDHNKKSKKQ